MTTRKGIKIEKPQGERSLPGIPAPTPASGIAPGYYILLAASYGLAVWALFLGISAW